MGEFEETEVHNRIRAAWAAFTQYKTVFVSKAYPFSSKAKLFENVVTPVAIYGSASWTLTKEMERLLVTTERRMLRAMLCKRRRPDEDWIAFVQRTTHEAESNMSQAGYGTWVEQYRTKKWRFAAKSAQSLDNRWNKRLLQWRPFFRCSHARSVDRPRLRWDDPIAAIANGN